MRNRYLGFILVSSFLAIIVIALKADDSENRGPTVNVSVQATDNSGGILHYSWRSTDGHIQDVNSSTTSWTLPTGHGIHFAYVLVSNGLGGYTERRLALNTDTIGASQESEDDANWLNNYIAPPAPAQVGDYYRSWVVSTASVNASRYFYVPGASVVLTDKNTGNTYATSGSVTTDIGGQYVVPGVPPTSLITATCTVAGVSSDCTSVSNGMLNTATTSYVTFSNFNGPPNLVGTFTLADGSICGTQNEFFNVTSRPPLASSTRRITCCTALFQSTSTATSASFPTRMQGPWFFNAKTLLA